MKGKVLGYTFVSVGIPIGPEVCRSNWWDSVASFQGHNQFCLFSTKEKAIGYLKRQFSKSVLIFFQEQICNDFSFVDKNNVEGVYRLYEVLEDSDNVELTENKD